MWEDSEVEVERRGSYTTPPVSVSLTQAHRQNPAESYTLKNILRLISKQQPEWGQEGGGRDGYRDNTEWLQYLHH